MASSVYIAKLWMRESFSRWKQFKNRVTMSEVGIRCASTAIVNFTDSSRVIVGQGCSLGAYSVLDVCDDPAAPQGKAALYLEDNVYIGEHCNIRASGSSIRIGNGTMIANSVVLVSANHQTKPDIPLRLQPWEVVRAGIEIGKECWLGSHSTILPGTVIGDGVVIAAGAVVRGTIPPNTIWGGVPAKFIKNR